VKTVVKGGSENEGNEKWSSGEGMDIELDEWPGVKRSGCERRDVISS
jgi:hypothetical protein